MKKTIGIGLAVLLALTVFSGCKAKTPTPTPIPTVVPEITTAPIATPADLAGTGNVGDTGLTDDGTSGTVTGIPDFREGTEVLESDVPDIRAALQEQYEGATITRITHGLQDSQQVYVVEYKSQEGQDKTVYMHPNGSFLPAIP